MSPRLIASELGLPTADVSRQVAVLAAQRSTSDTVVGCWVSPGWSGGLGVPAGQGWPDQATAGADEGLVGGLVGVVVARQHRYDQVGVCGYLVDVHCLGVKNAMGPLVMPADDLDSYVERFYAGFAGPGLAAPLSLAQHLVLGAVAYARRLGFGPHHDFVRAASYLGDWSDPSAITFGRDGRPFYWDGPDDDRSMVLETLDRTVGRGRYGYRVAVDAH